MEQAKKDQAAFVGMKTDLNPTLVKSEEGIYTHSLNGKVIKKTGRNYAWENLKGTKRIFEIPVLKDEVVESAGSANLYFFDWRQFVDNWKTATYTIPQQTLIFGFVLKTNDLDFTPTEQVQFSCWIYINTGGNLLTVIWAIGDTTAYVGAHVYTIPLTDISANNTYKTIVHFVLAKFVEDYYPYRFLPISGGVPFSQISIELGKHKTHVKDIPAEPELEHDIDELFDCTYYIKFTHASRQLIIEAKGLTEPDVTYWPNTKGWGLGSKSGKMHSIFASTPPYPTPGSDANINPIAIEQPGGITTNYKTNRWYWVLGGTAQHQNVLYTTGTYFYTGIHARVDHITHDTKVMELTPRYPGYGLTKTLAIETRWVYPNTPEIVHFIAINDDELVVFATIPNERALIYKVSFGNESSITNTLMDTTSFAFGKNFQFQCIDRNESDQSHKLFWSEGEGVLRFIDLNKLPEVGNEDFDTRLFKTSNNFGNIKIDKANRFGGNLLVGSYRVAFCLSHDGFVWTRYSPITNAVSLGQGYSSTIDPTKPLPTNENDPEYRGYPPGTKTTQSLSIEVTNIDRNFKYIKIASIEYVSGSGTPIVNIVFKKELVGTDYQRILANYGGIQDVVESGLTISDIINPKIILDKTKALTHGQNRLIVANYKEPILKLTSDSNLGTDDYLNNLDLQAVRKYIGYDNSYSTINGYKSSENQLNYKSLQIREKYTFAWVLIDEYGNASDPFGEFEFDKLLNYDKMFFQGGVPLSPVQTHPRYSGVVFAQYAYGMRINLENIVFPSWAKKAILVRQIRDNSNQTVMLSGSGILYPSVNQKRITNAIIPDLYGSNTAEKYTWQDGDEIHVLNEFELDDEYGLTKFPFPSYNYSEIDLFATPPYACVWGTTPMYCNGDIEMNFKPQRITSFLSSSIFPLAVDPLTKGYGWGIDFDSAYNVYTNTRSRYCHFIILRPRFKSGLGFVKKYENTGFELDLRFRHPYKIDVFGGDVYNSVFPVMGATGTDARTNTTYAAQNILTVVQSKHNYSLINNAEQAHGVLNPDYNRFSYNRDYSPNPDNSYIKIDESVSNLKEDFSNTIAFSDVRISNALEESYAVFKANNVVDVSNNFGKINSIQFLYDYLFIIQERGIVAVPASNKEFVATEAGTKIKTGDPAQFISLTDVIHLSEKFGGQTSIKTQKGVYTFDLINKVFVVIGFGQSPQAIPLSIEKEFNTIFNDSKQSQYSNSILNTGYTLGYDNTLGKVYLTIFNKIIEDCTIQLTGAIYEAIVATDSQFVKGQYVQFDSDEFYAIFKITDIVDYQESKRILIEPVDTDNFGDNLIRNDISSFPVTGKLSSVDYKYLSLAFNEKTGELEGLLTIPASKYAYVNEQVVYLDAHHNKVIHYLDYVDSGKQNEFSFDTGRILNGYHKSIIPADYNLDTYSLFHYRRYNKIHGFVVPSQIFNSPPAAITLDLFTTTWGIITTASIPIINVYSATKQKYRFFKGHTYTITYTMDWLSGTQFIWAHLGLMPFMYQSFVQLESGNYYDTGKSFYPENIGQVKTQQLVFTAIETFETSLFVLIKDVNAASNRNGNGGTFAFEITEIKCHEDYISEVEVAVFDGQSKDNVFDNAFINKNNLELIDDVYVETPVVSHIDQGKIKQKNRKNRLKIELPRKPKDIGFERMNGIWAKIRFTIKNNLPNFVIDNISTLYRKLPK